MGDLLSMKRRTISAPQGNVKFNGAAAGYRKARYPD
jgi:hypothetical protein